MEDPVDRLETLPFDHPTLEENREGSSGPSSGTSKRPSTDLGFAPGATSHVILQSIPQFWQTTQDSKCASGKH
jgi:hypothetical protein